MKYVGENALKKWTSLVKSDLKKKLDKNQGTANSGKILGVNATGEVAPTDTEVATLVDVPNGIVKGDGSTLSAAVAGTDYVAPNGDASNVTAAFTAASTRANITTGEKLSVLFGKITKWFADLGSLAFKNTVAKSDLASDVQTSLGKADSALQSAPVTSVNGKTGAVTISVPTIPSTTNLIKGDGSGGLVAATPETDYASPVFMRKVTLTTAGWNSSTKQQSVTVSSILADTTKQCIYPAPVDTSYDSVWNSCGVLCVAQSANSLTFQCSEIPTSAIEVYVTVITLNYKG